MKPNAGEDRDGSDKADVSEVGCVGAEYFVGWWGPSEQSRDKNKDERTIEMTYGNLPNPCPLRLSEMDVIKGVL